MRKFKLKLLTVVATLLMIPWVSQAALISIEQGRETQQNSMIYLRVMVNPQEHNLQGAQFEIADEGDPFYCDSDPDYDPDDPNWCCEVEDRDDLWCFCNETDDGRCKVMVMDPRDGLGQISEEEGTITTKIRWHTRPSAPVNTHVDLDLYQLRLPDDRNIDLPSNYKLKQNSSIYIYSIETIPPTWGGLRRGGNHFWADRNYWPPFKGDPYDQISLEVYDNESIDWENTKFGVQQYVWGDPVGSLRYVNYTYTAITGSYAVNYRVDLEMSSVLDALPTDQGYFYIYGDIRDLAGNTNSDDQWYDESHFYAELRKDISGYVRWGNGPDEGDGIPGAHMWFGEYHDYESWYCGRTDANGYYKCENKARPGSTVVGTYVWHTLDVEPDDSQGRAGHGEISTTVPACCNRTGINFTVYDPNAVTTTSTTSSIQTTTTTSIDLYHNIRGWIVKESDGTYIPNTTVWLEGDFGSATDVTDALGGFFFSNYTNGQYRLTPYHLDYTFDPPYMDITVNGGDVNVGQWPGTPTNQTYKVCAILYDYRGGSIGGVLSGYMVHLYKGDHPDNWEFVEFKASGVNGFVEFNDLIDGETYSILPEQEWMDWASCCPWQQPYLVHTVEGEDGDCTLGCEYIFYRQN